MRKIELKRTSVDPEFSVSMPSMLISVRLLFLRCIQLLVLTILLKGISDFGDIFDVLTFFVRKYENISIISDALTNSLIKQNSELHNYLSF